MSKTIKNTALLIWLAILSYHCSTKTTEVAMPDKVQELPAVVKEDFRKTAPVPAPAPKINIGKAESFDLPNGLKVIVVKNDKLPQVSYQISLINDQIPEGDKVGYIAMTGDILSRGTSTKTKAEIDESVDFLGASLSTSSGGMFGSSLTKHSDKLLEIMSDVLFNPSFPEAELEKIKTQTISGIASNKTDPNAIMGNMKSAVNYGKEHPYGEIQKEENVKAITIDDLKTYYQNYFVPNNAYLIIVGDIDVNQAKTVANKYFADWKPKPIPQSTLAQVNIPASREVRFANKEGAVQSVIHVSYPVNLRPGDPDVIPSSVMNSILGGGFSSRLMQNLREDKAYTYGSSSGLRSDALIGNFVATASVRNEVTDSSVQEILNEMERIREMPVSNEELQSIKNYMTGGFARSLESPQTIARFAYNTYRYNLPDDYYATYLEKLNAVTTSDIQQMAAKYILPENANIYVVGSKDEVAESLKRLDTDGEISFYDAFGDEVKYEEMALPAGVTGESIIEDYLNAIGGAQKIATIKSLRMKMSAAIMGQPAEIESYQVEGNKYAMSFAMAGQVMQEQVFDGSKIKMTAQGQSQIVTDEAAIADMKSQSKIVAQSEYLNNGTTMKVEGIDDIEGVKAYKVVVTEPGGKVSTEYYSVDSGLLIRSLTTPQEGQSVIADLMDYREVSGVLFPHATTVSGMMPFPLEMKVEEMEVNGALPEGLFDIK